MVEDQSVLMISVMNGAADAARRAAWHGGARDG